MKKRLITKTSKIKFKPFDNYGNVFKGMDWHKITYDKKTGQGSYILRLKPNFNVRHKSKALSAKHRIRLYPETYHALKVASDYSKKSIANMIKELVDESDDEFISKARKISKIMIKEFYEN